MPRILMYDIETGDLNADFGQLLVFGYKWLGEPAQAVAMTDFNGWKKDLTYDGKVARAAHEILGQADIRVGYYSTGFDRPYLTAKFMYHGLPPQDNTPEIDLYYHAKQKLKISRRSLENVGVYLGLEGSKLKIDALTWRKAKVGDKDAINLVRQHCLQDLDLTEELYLKLRPMIATHPRVGSYYCCAGCGSNHLTRQGKKFSRSKGDRIKVQCQDCSHWMTFGQLELDKWNVATN